MTGKFENKKTDKTAEKVADKAVIEVGVAKFRKKEELKNSIKYEMRDKREKLSADIVEESLIAAEEKEEGDSLKDIELDWGREDEVGEKEWEEMMERQKKEKDEKDEDDSLKDIELDWGRE